MKQKLTIVCFDRCTNKYHTSVWENITIQSGLIINNTTKESKLEKNINKVLDINNTYEIYFIDLNAHNLINDFMDKVLNYGVERKKQLNNKIDDLSLAMEIFYRMFTEYVNNLVTEEYKRKDEQEEKQASKQASKQV